MQRLSQDPRFCARKLITRSGFILIAISTLAVGTGFTHHPRETYG